ncbi:Pectate lyase superfamily protein [Chryseobacterium gleum]|uniref:Pectate lyase superfamily protein n=2 Tax=Chryseobacterium gleum TaxID=250 RepID=A0A448BAQ4_CHRGE|nr:hypothetical protein [Chryseobacterium gleum]EFK35846.1 hypothetical protein HMPREF0204_14915 [Chryseobacterium gleum ATCC 35910]MCD9617716.1 hypothetical protein [Chryseobacterium gleum]MCE4064105.1 hypothetical protein [Chryseobacterium gleum]QQY31568.1 hypothetical protein I6I60_22360 [Chryseobacterium gleum]VEE11630.1 Pectate lyase superfamily protein [Chryseobacterium gleum]
MKTLKSFLILGLSTFSTICCSQRKDKVAVDNSLIVNQKITVQTNDFFKIETVLPKGYVKDGSVDYTAYIQKAIDGNSKVMMPDFPLMTSGIFAQSNSQIYFQKNSSLILKPTADVRYQIISLHAVENVKIYNPTLIGDRDRHLGSKGEWGFGIDIRGSRNIEIYNANISDCWGDGIVLVKTMRNMRSGVAKENIFPTENINIIGGFINNVRRNGITIAGGKDIIIKNLLIANINGTNPMAGIDIEPDDSSNILENINIENVKINNVNVGIDLNLPQYGNQNISKSVTISCKDISVENANSGIYIAGYKDKPNIKEMTGYFKVDNFVTNNVTRPFEKRDQFGLYPTIQMNNYKFNINNKIDTSTQSLLKNVKDNSKLKY